MTTYKGNNIKPVIANNDIINKFNQLDVLHSQLKKLSSEYSELIKDLPLETPLVYFDGSDYRTRVVDKPSGHYVNYYDLVFTMDTKTTKSDIKELNLDE